MFARLRACGVHLGRWWVRRNPTYLCSAALMALGARLYLDSPDVAAGDLAQILLTLGILQAYVASVSGILVALARGRRGHDDFPSLLLIGAGFWTGPLAATLELTQHDRTLGLACAAGVAVLALVEFFTVRRELKLSLSPLVQLAAVYALLLITAAPAWLEVRRGALGTSEPVLYLFWWLLAGGAGLAIPAIRVRLKTPVFEKTRNPQEILRPELLFLAMVYAAAAVHLWAMNYAFFGHARAVYAAPLLAAAALAGTELFARLHVRDWRIWSAWLLLPVVGIGLATQGVHPRLSAAALPDWLTDPLVITLALAATVWWHAAARRGEPLLIHAGAAAAALLMFHVAPIEWQRPGPGPVWAPASGLLPMTQGDLAGAGPPVLPLELAVALMAMAGYCAVMGWWRRARFERMVAWVLAVSGAVVAVVGRTPMDVLAVPLILGWGSLVAAHVWARRPGWMAKGLPVLLLALTSCEFEFDDGLRWAARLHAVAMALVLLLIGWRARGTRYVSIAGAASGLWALVVVARAIALHANPAGAATVLLAFALLSVGAVISWRKVCWRDHPASTTATPALPAAPGSAGS